MERSEPALVPEWLRSAGSVTGAGSSAHHSASSSTHSDSSFAAQHSRNRSSRNISDFDSPRSAFLERSSSSNSRRSSINGSTKHAYSNFNRNSRDREKERMNFEDRWDRDPSDPLIGLFSGRLDRDTLRRSYSMVSRKQSEILPRRVAVDSKTGCNSKYSNGNGLLSGASIGSSIQKAVFDKDFPSLGSEEKQGISEIGRVSSPGLVVTSSQSLPVGSSALIGGEGWTSALAEVPTIIGNSNTGSLTMQQPASTTSGPPALSTTAGLNMAEALAQNPSRARSTPQVSVNTQRREELAIKQSRQLIPVTPSMPKASVLASEKLKPKTAVRTAELNVAGKSGPQQPSLLHISNLSIRGGTAKSDATKTSGKFTDLKSVMWENGHSPTSKDVSSPTNLSNIRSGNNLAAASPVTSTPLRNPNNPKSSTDQKPALVDPKLGSTMDKKPSLSQVQSRNDFFKLLKKNTMKNSSTGNTDQPLHSSPAMEKSAKLAGDEVSPPSCPQALGNVEVTSNGVVHEEARRFPDNEEKDSVQSDTVYPDEEEAAFLRSLGWEDNSGEDEGLTEEEINAFYQRFMELGPTTTTFKLCQRIQPKHSKLFEPCATNSCGALVESSSSDSDSDSDA